MGSVLIIYQPHFTEEERQMVLLALAELSIARPGWVEGLGKIALLMDEPNPEGNATLFERFRRNHSDAVAERLIKS